VECREESKPSRIRRDVLLFLLERRAGSVDVHRHVPLPLLPRESFAFAFLAEDGLEVLGDVLDVDSAFEGAREGEEGVVRGLSGLSAV
jgi:hypothetical protein